MLRRDSVSCCRAACIPIEAGHTNAVERLLGRSGAQYLTEQWNSRSRWRLSEASTWSSVCNTAEPVPQHEWSAALAEYARLSERDAGRARMLVITDGGGPNAKQRSQLKAIWDGRAVTTSVIVPGMNNLVKRGLMTALTWINPQMAFFEPSQLRPALRHLGLEAEQAALWTLLHSLQEQLTPVRTLALLEAAAQNASRADEASSQRTQ